MLSDLSPLDLFLDLAAIPSPPGEERAVADRGGSHSSASCGWRPTRTRAGAVIGSQIGNVY